jgi:hypothetical protein
MKKVLLVALVGAAVVGVVVVASGASKAATPEGKMCLRLAELCSTEQSAKDFDQCVDGMKDLRKMSGDSSFERSQKCLDESKSCAAATGCMIGGAGVGSLGEFMKGFGTALSK